MNKRSSSLFGIEDKILKIAVIGASVIDKDTYTAAYEVGKHIALNKAILVCGGLGGVMEASSKGAKDAGGLTIGILPTVDEKSANKYIDIIISTPMGSARNPIVVASAHSVIAVGGGYGTLSEMGYALLYERPLIALSTWKILPSSKDIGTHMIKADNPSDAVRVAIEEASKEH